MKNCRTWSTVCDQWGWCNFIFWRAFTFSWLFFIVWFFLLGTYSNIARSNIGDDFDFEVLHISIWHCVQTPSHRKGHITCGNLFSMVGLFFFLLRKWEDRKYVNTMFSQNLNFDLLNEHSWYNRILCWLRLLGMSMIQLDLDFIWTDGVQQT